MCSLNIVRQFAAHNGATVCSILFCSQTSSNLGRCSAYASEFGIHKIFSHCRQIQEGINSKNVYALQIELIMYCFLVLFLFLFIDRMHQLQATKTAFLEYRCYIANFHLSVRFNKIHLFMFNTPAILHCRSDSDRPF